MKNNSEQSGNSGEVKVCIIGAGKPELHILHPYIQNTDIGNEKAIEYQESRESMKKEILDKLKGIMKLPTPTGGNIVRLEDVINEINKL